MMVFLLDITAHKMLSRAVIDRALYDLLNKRRNTEFVVSMRNNARHFLIDSTKEMSAQREMFCCMADIDSESLKDMAEQYAGEY